MTVYLDLVMGLNFLVDFLLLMGTNRLSGFPAAPGRCALAAALGGVYSGACLLPGFSFLGNPLWRIVSLMIMLLLCFGLNRSALTRGLIFWILSMALGGMAMSFGRGEAASLALWAVVLWLMCRFAFRENPGIREYIPLQITYGEKTVSVLALHDTGNTLKDPITSEQVLVLAGEAACRLTGLTIRQLQSPLETMAARALPGLRLIPYRAVGGSGMLLGMRFQDVRIGSKRRSAIVAFAPEGLGKDQMYQALTGGVL